LLARLGGHLDLTRNRIGEALTLGDEELIEAVGGRWRDAVRREVERFDAAIARASIAAAGLEALCRCDPEYPAPLRELDAPPSVIHIAGGVERFVTLLATETVAIVGARKASSYGLGVARDLGRSLGSANVAVLSGMALGVDSAAHAGALEAGAATVAVLPAGADRPYPPSKRGLHRQIRAKGAVAAELPPGSATWRWTFPARNRIIAALATLTIVVEAGERSGALITAMLARQLGRAVGAVPGRLGSPLAQGPNGLLAEGAAIVRGPQDVLDVLYGAGVRHAPSPRRPELTAGRRALLAAIAAGRDTPSALAGAGFAVEELLASLAALELDGYVRRAAGGRFAVLS
jgi:DNA processing protein